MAVTRNLTIMFVDMVGYTQRTATQSRAANSALRRNFNHVLAPIISGYTGRIVKSLGDALLATFNSPTDGVRCGMALHDAVAEFNLDRKPAEQIQIRVAVNVGEVLAERRDIFGEAVNVASRVEGMTPPGEIYFTEAVYLSMNKAEVPSESAGKHKLKGIPEPVKLYRVPTRQVSRLVSAGEELSPDHRELPFGGMHHKIKVPRHRSVAVWVRTRYQSEDVQKRVKWLRALPWKYIGPAAGGLAVVATATALLIRPVPDEETESGQEVTTQEHVPPEFSAMPADQRKMEARKHADLGHAALRDGDRRAAARNYGKALQLDPELKNNVAVAAGLVVCLSWASDIAMPIIRKNGSPALVKELTKRTAEPGALGRQRAAELLRDLGHRKAIDETGLLLADLGEAESCEERLRAVKGLRRLKDPRALPALKNEVSGNLGKFFSNMCLRGEAQAAIQEIEGRRTN